MLLKLSNSKIYNPDAGYSEIGQTIPIKFAFAKVVDGTVYPLHKPVKCRDFLLDTVLWARLKIKNGVRNVYGYGFSEPEKQYQMLLYQAPLIKDNLELLNQIEEENGLKPSVVTKTNEAGTFLLEGDQRIQESTELLSLHTLVVRFLSKQVKSRYDLQSDLKDYLGVDNLNLFKWIMKKVPVPSNHKDAGNPQAYIHDNIGIQYYINGMKSYYPTQYKELNAYQ